MSCLGTPDESACPCESFVFPTAIANPPGLSTIAYRPGDFTNFRHALLLARPGETQLSATVGSQVMPIWRPGAQGDLAVQMIEWWAYVCDVLTFYNERIANQAYLSTADLPESVNRLIMLLGYRPKPGIGATGTLAALATGPNSFTLPVGFQIQSKPGPGEQPQVFELRTAATITPPLGIGPPGTGVMQGVAVAMLPPSTGPAVASNGMSVVLSGTTSAIKAGDRVLILPTPPSQTNFAVATVAGLSPGKDSLGKAFTKVTFTTSLPALSGDAGTFQLWRTSLSTQPWQYPADPSFVIRPGAAASSLQVDLASIARGLQPGSPIVFEATDTSTSQYGPLINSTEAVWYVNPANYTPGDPTSGVDPSMPPTPPSGSTQPPIAIPIPHTRITFGWPSGASTSLTNLPAYIIRYGWTVVGPLTTIPPTVVGVSPNTESSTSGSSDPTTTPLALSVTDVGPLSLPDGTPVLVQDVNGNGATGTITGGTTLTIPAPVPMMVPPLQTLLNLLNVTRGKTVANEVLGGGNALVAGQDFTLQNSPVTYLADPNAISGETYSSTVSVSVNQLRWSEVRSFYGQSPNAQVFVTREDEQGKTHVVFGDGVNGARLPTGVNNVVASYRYGSGAALPDPGSLTVVLQPRPGLRSIVNPVAVRGGSDPDPPSLVRQRAPQTVLTFDRAISVDDFQTIAAQTAGVTRARAALAFDPLSQRPRVTVWVGDDGNAVAAARQAFAATADPNRQPSVVLAQAVKLTLSLTIVYDPRYSAPDVQAAVYSALLDPDLGLLGVNVVQIGQAIYDSQVYASCLAVPGVVSVHSLDFNVTNTKINPIYTKFRGPELIRLIPISATSIRVVSRAPSADSGQRHDPGADAFFFLPDDGQSLAIDTEAAS